MKRILAAAALLALAAAIWYAPTLLRGKPTAPLQIRAPRSSQRPPPSHVPAKPFSLLVRVNLTPSAPRQLTVDIDGPWTVRAEGSSQVLARGDRLVSADVRATPSGFRIGPHDVASPRIELIAENAPGIWVGDHQYRGAVRLYHRPGERLMAVNVLPLEQYVASVIDSEMPLVFGETAREAQAIVARTYVLHQMQTSRTHPHFDVYATTRSQKYLGLQYRVSDGRRLAGESESSRAIAARTAGIVCIWQGRLFCTYYSAVCGGRTTDGRQVFSDAAPPLAGVPCDGCRDAPLYRWQSRLSKADAARALRPLLARRGVTLKQVSALDQQPTNGNGAFSISDGRRQHAVTAADLRGQLPPGTLHSPHFTVRDEGETLLFDGRGHGHGVGFCQWGARGQAQAGRTALQIIRHYYPGCDVVRMSGE